jgi:hypothetical protein
MAGILALLPDSVTPGETLSVTVTHADYTPDAGYTLAYRFAAPTPITVAGVNNGAGGWTVTLTSTQTLTLARGDMAFDALVTLAGVATAIDRGTIYVHASPLATSQWTAVLASVNAAIAAQATSGQQSGTLSVDGLSQSFTYRSKEDLLALRAFCMREIARDKGVARPYRILSRYSV